MLGAGGPEEAVSELSRGTSVFPPGRPLVFHNNSIPSEPPLAAKNNVPFTLVRNRGLGLTPAPILMRVVPATLPSLFHSSTPLELPLALKNSAPFTFVSSIG